MNFLELRLIVDCDNIPIELNLFMKVLYIFLSAPWLI